MTGVGSGLIQVVFAPLLLCSVFSVVISLHFFLIPLIRTWLSRVCKRDKDEWNLILRESCCWKNVLQSINILICTEVYWHLWSLCRNIYISVLDLSILLAFFQCSLFLPHVQPLRTPTHGLSESVNTTRVFAFWYPWFQPARLYLPPKRVGQRERGPCMCSL